MNDALVRPRIVLPHDPSVVVVERTAGVALVLVSAALLVMGRSIVLATLPGGTGRWLFGDLIQGGVCGNAITDPVVLAADWAPVLGVIGIVLLAHRPHRWWRIGAAAALVSIAALILTLGRALAGWKRAGLELDVWWL